MSVFRIDAFEVPADVVTELRAAAWPTLQVIRAQDGYIRDQWFEKATGAGKINVVTLAEWRDAESIDRAVEAVRVHNAKTGADPAAFLSKRGIVAHRSVFNALPDSELEQ